MRGSARLGVCAVGAAVVLGSAACGGGGTPAAAPVSAAPKFTATLAPGFSAQPTWSDTLAWTMAMKSSGQTVAPDEGLMAMQAEGGLVRVIGSSVVAVTFSHGRSASGGTSDLQFRSLATGALLNTVHLPFGDYAGMRADSVAGRPVVVAHYTSTAPADEQANGGQPVKITSVYGADGSLLWTSLGRAVAAGSADSSGLETDGNGYPIFSGGYTLRYNGSPDMDTAKEGYDVLNAAGSVVLHVPRQADANQDAATVSLADGYALVGDDNRNAVVDDSAIRVSMTAYDLNHGAVRVGSWSEPGSSADGEKASLLAATGGRLLVDWLGPSQTLSAPTSLAVLDTATGRARIVSGVPAALAAPNSLGAVADPATGDVLTYDVGQMSGPSVLIRLASSAVAWAQEPNQTSLLPISVHDGVIYALHLGSASSPLTLATVRESDGAITASGYQIAPVGFTGGGAAVFAQSTSPTTLSAIQIGVSPPATGRG